jgi:hypothetical protein
MTSRTNVPPIPATRHGHGTHGTTNTNSSTRSIPSAVLSAVSVPMRVGYQPITSNTISRPSTIAMRPLSPRDKTPIVMNGNIINSEVTTAPPQHILTFPATPAVGSVPIPPLNSTASTVEPIRRSQSPVTRTPPRIPGNHAGLQPGLPSQRLSPSVVNQQVSATVTLQRQPSPPNINSYQPPPSVTTYPIVDLGSNSQASVVTSYPIVNSVQYSAPPPTSQQYPVVNSVQTQQYPVVNSVQTQQYSAPPPTSQQYSAPPPTSQQYSAPPTSQQYPVVNSVQTQQYLAPPTSQQYQPPPSNQQYSVQPPTSQQYPVVNSVQTQQYSAPPTSQQYQPPPSNQQYSVQPPTSQQYPVANNVQTQQYQQQPPTSQQYPVVNNTQTQAPGAQQYQPPMPVSTSAILSIDGQNSSPRTAIPSISTQQQPYVVPYSAQYLQQTRVSPGQVTTTTRVSPVPPVVALQPLPPRVSPTLQNNYQIPQPTMTLPPKPVRMSPVPPIVSPVHVQALARVSPTTQTLPRTTPSLQNGIFQIPVPVSTASVYPIPTNPLVGTGLTTGTPRQNTGHVPTPRLNTPANLQPMVNTNPTPAFIPVRIPSPQQMGTRIGTVGNQTPPLRASSPILLQNPNDVQVNDIRSPLIQIGPTPRTQLPLQMSPGVLNGADIPIPIQIPAVPSPILTEMSQQSPPTTNSQINTGMTSMPRMPIRPDYVNMDPLMQQEMRVQFRVKFGTIRTNYPQYNIQEPPEGSSLDTIHNWYESYVRQIVIAMNSNQWMLYLYIALLAIEVIGIKVFKLNFSGFFKSQMRIVHRYQTLLVELGEKYYSPTGSSWSVEAKLIFLCLGNAVVFIVVRYLASFLGAGIADTIHTAFDQLMDSGTINPQTLGIAAPTPAAAAAAPNINPNAPASQPATASAPAADASNPLSGIMNALGGMFNGGGAGGGANMLGNIVTQITSALGGNAAAAPGAAARGPVFAE